MAEVKMAEMSQRLQRTRKDHFLQLMFFQASRPDLDAAAPQQDQPLSDPQVPLHSFVARPGVRFVLPSRREAPQVRIDSPATEVMTDLRVVTPVTISPDASIDAANQLMIDKRVRALFVVDDATPHILGLVTATDTLGERPLQVAQQRQIRRGDLVVRDIMTGADKLEALDLHDVARALVGNIVATLQHAGRQHALAVEVADGGDAGAVTVCGIFSLTQIARQLGIPPGPTHDIAATFAEIERAIA
jgi:CBS domain-containing protein